MFADQQVHALPDDPLRLLRIARALDYEDGKALQARLDGERAVVPRLRRAAEIAPRQADRSLPRAVLGMRCRKVARRRCWPKRASTTPPRTTRACATSRARRRCAIFPSARASASTTCCRRCWRRRRAAPAPDAALPRGLALLQSIARRTSYLALLDEQPAALARLVDVIARSSLLAERLADHPLLLDELLDSRAAGACRRKPGVRAALRAAAAAHAHDDAESALAALNERGHSLAFRIALPALALRQPPQHSAALLAALAEEVVAAVLALAQRELEAAHGASPEPASR
jgi:glutamate-ammonia-ligase adenylyltransferase